MSDFERLHPALKHHIVNSLGWRELRPFQDAVIAPILNGVHMVIVAPTAGGKTEAALFPLFSRMLDQTWPGLSVLYVCPIKALLNDLDLRLRRYCGFLGRRAACWHGDVGPGQRKSIVHDPPDVLLTTPESLEVMLLSNRVDEERFFRDVRAVVVDEIHAFAGDDRGVHLLAVLERITRLAGRELQRIGLSATIGDPEALLHWLAGWCDGPKQVYMPSHAMALDAEVKVDFVGSMANAAKVLSRLYRGEKRLVFLDSRARAEDLAARLKELDTRTFITHSSLSREQRTDAEKAFSNLEDCIIVATSVLELGVDVGDLDRVVQIDAPRSVSSFLQRMGRTGRRPGMQRNCLFLATNEESLLQAAGLVELWKTGYVEAAKPPAQPWHVFAQQVMALAVQENGIGRKDWRRWIGRLPQFAELSANQAQGLIDFMVAQDILSDEDGILWFGRKGEETFGRRHFMELLSTISGEPLFAILHGSSELGSVHPISFAQKQEGPLTLLLAGRSWTVREIDWRHKMAHVEPATDRGHSAWVGPGMPLGFELCQSMKQVLQLDTVSAHRSHRCVEKLGEIRADYPWLEAGRTSLVFKDKSVTWWTFAGLLANAMLAHELSKHVGGLPDYDNLGIYLQHRPSDLDLVRCVETMRLVDPAAMFVPVSANALENLKFSVCLPEDAARRILSLRLSDCAALQKTLSQQVVSVMQPS